MTSVNSTMDQHSYLPNRGKLATCIISGLIICFIGLLVPQTGLSQSSGFDEKAEAFISPYMHYSAFNGCILLAKDGEIKYEKCLGFQDQDKGIKNSTLTKFRIGSLTKNYTEAGIFLLVQSGKLKLNQSLDSYLPDLPNAEKITINHLLNHRSGIRNISSLPEYNNLAKKEYSTKDAYELVKQLPNDFKPGSKRQYSNSGYIVLARLIEKVTGKSFADYMSQSIMAPFGLQNTSFESRPSHLAQGYIEDPQSTGLIKSQYWHPSIKVGGGNISATTRDVFQFFSTYFQSQPASSRASPVSRYQGNTPGYTSIVIRHHAADLTVVVLANNESWSSWSLGSSLAKIYLGHQIQPFDIENVQNLSSEELQAYQGDFKAGRLVFSTYLNGEQLIMHGTKNGRTHKLFPYGKASFFCPLYWSILTFKRRKNGSYDKEVKWTDVAR